MANDDATWRLEEDDLPPSEVTAELFAEHRVARRGTANPERMTNPVWTWLARRSELNPYLANKHFGTEYTGDRYPGWSNSRFGQTVTPLPDGRVLAVAGEHEDYYDPDFFIYNDVIVTGADGTLEVFGYTTDAFPPTDFHSATLVDDHLYLIGNVGYQEDRSGVTQVLRLDVRSLVVERLTPTGDSPGWLSGHSATLDADGRSVRVSGGKVGHSSTSEIGVIHAVDDYVLDLVDLAWRRVTDRGWRQYVVSRTDGYGQLWEVGQLAYYSELSDDWAQAQAADYRQRLSPGVDLTAWRARFRPPVRHEPVPDDPEEWRTHRIVVDGTTVRYVDEHGRIVVVVEGPLPVATEAAIVEDLREKLARAEAAEYTATQLDPTG